MAESTSIGEWQELVKSCNESGQSKAVFYRANCERNNLNYHAHASLRLVLDAYGLPR